MADLLASLEAQHNIPSGMLGAVMQVESGGNMNAVSPAGAMGPFQLMPPTAAEQGVRNPFDINQAAPAAAKILAANHAKYGDWSTALAAYNAGGGAVDKAGGIPNNGETPAYVQKVNAAMPIDPTKVQWDDAQPQAQQAAPEQIDPSKVRWDQPAQAAQPNQNDKTDPNFKPLSGMLGGIGTGIGDFAGGAVRAITSGMGALGDMVAPNSDFTKGAHQAVAQMDATKAHEDALYAAQRAQQGGSGTDWARMAGQVAPSLAMPMSGGGVIPAALSGAASGAIQGAVNTGPGQSYAGNMALGAGAGGVAGGAAGVLGNIVGGARMTPAAQRMVDMGVTPTPGQAAGGLPASIEEKMKTVPGLGEAIRGAQTNATQQFNRSMYQNALAPIGAQLPADVQAGSAGIDHVATQIGNIYQAIEPQVQFAPRGQFIRDVSNIESGLRQNAPAVLPQFQNIVQGQIADKVAAGPNPGVMNGAQWGDTRSTISGIARGQRLGNATPDNRALADALDDLNDSMNQQVYRNSPPGIQPQLQAANAAWARYKPMEAAAGSTGASNNGNIFSAAQYAAAIRKGSTSSQKATNSGLNAGIAQDAQSVLGQHIPNSGTAERSAAIGVPAAIGGLVMSGHPLAAAGAAGGIGAGMAAYGTQGGRQAMLSLLFQRPDLMRQLAPLLSGAGGVAGAAGGNAATQGQ